MPLDPQIKALLDAQANAPKPHQQTVEEARASMLARPRQPGPPMAHEEDRRIPGPGGEIPIRIFRPSNADGSVLVFYHGGGWVLGNLDTHAGNCRNLAQHAGCTVIAVDYREAPEHRFPAAADDAYAAAAWAAANAAELGVDASRLAVGGESAGGNLAAVVCLMARDRGGPAIKQQWLAYPVMDYSFDRPSYAEVGEGYGLEKASMEWFWNHYLGPDSDGSNPYASPLRAQSLAGLPPAIVVTCEFDPLRDEGNAYADRLSREGVPVELRCVPGVNHAFLSMPVDAAAAAYDEIGRLLRAGFSR
ncbi:MAG TPA: alpha/beta hydrolase [Chloroflexota bacterium]|nr:alpha/beta hydrolase [Chloroflexota bacterium]